MMRKRGEKVVFGGEKISEKKNNIRYEKDRNSFFR
jgi:hypothetical protein